MHLTIRLHVDVKSSEIGGTMSVGAVAGRFGLASHVLRYWEDMGLIDPDRDGNGRRRYGPQHLVRVAMILRAKEAGLSLESIARMLSAETPADRRETLLRQREVLAERIERLRQSLQLVDCALDCDHEDIATCPRFLQVVADLTDGLAPSDPGVRSEPGARRMAASPSRDLP